eukprot:g20099.t1
MKVSFWTSSALTGPQPRLGFVDELRAFRSDESGVLAKPMIMILVLMFALGGLGMDLVRMERDRTNLQYTLDRAVLAAADLDQPLDPEAVVIDYMSKSGLGEYTTVVVPEVSPTAKRVKASVDTEFTAGWMNSIFYEDYMRNPDTYELEPITLPLLASSTAVESIGNVEISLVLDVSGSMRSNNRLVNLKRAAKEFVQTMDDNTEDGKMSISIVPYSTQVSMPAAFLDEMRVSDEHSYSNCINFDGSDFNTTGLNLSREYERTMHFSVWNYNDYRDDDEHVRQPTCASDADNPERTALLMSDNVAQLQSYIDAFEHSENTSIDLGMKWGTALLDPSVQPIIATLANDANPNQSIEARYANRPVSYQDTETLKVIVMMTDGQNTAQYYIKNDYREGLTPVWYNSEENVYSTYDPNRYGSDKYYWHQTGEWEDHPYGNGTYEETMIYRTSIPALVQKFRRNEDGNATIEFAILFPLMLMVLFAAVELGMINYRQIMLDRAMDMTVRDIRLGTGGDMQHDDIRDTICARSGFIKMAECNVSLKLEMVRLDPFNWGGIPPQADCVDSVEEADPLINFTNGGSNDLMFLRACASVDVLFPNWGLGDALQKDDGGRVNLYASSAFETVISKAAYTVSDLISRETAALNDDYIDSIYTLGKLMARAGSDMSMRVSVIRWDANDDRYYVDWSVERGDQMEIWTDANVTALNNKLPLMPDQERVIVVETWNDVEPAFRLEAIGVGKREIYNLVFTRPRFASQVAFEGSVVSDGSVHDDDDDAGT